MLETEINAFDAAVIGVIALSGLLSFFRGFIREILSLGAWVGASIITLYTFPAVARAVQPHVNNTAAASGLAAIGTFVAALMIISILNSLMLRMFKKGSDVGLLDNWLGLVFGILRGVLLVALVFFAITLVLKEDDYPEWMKNARTRSFVEGAASVIGKIAPSYLDELTPLKEQPNIQEGEVPPPDGAAQPGESSYDLMNVEQLERIIEHSGEDTQ